MAIDTSAFERFKKAVEPKPIDLSAFGKGVYTPEKKVQPRGIVKTVISQIPSFAKKQYEVLQAKTPEERAELVAKFTPLNIAKFIVQGTLGGLTALGRSGIETIATPLGQKEKVRSGFATQKTIDEKLFGGEVDTYQQITEKVRSFVDRSPDATPFEKTYLPAVIGFGLFAADAFPGKPNLKKQAANLIEDIAESADPADISKKLTDFGVPENLAVKAAPRLVEAKTPESVRAVLSDISNKEVQNMLRVVDGNVPTTLPKTTETTTDVATPPKNFVYREATPNELKQLGGLGSPSKGSMDVAADINLALGQGRNANGLIYKIGTEKALKGIQGELPRASVSDVYSVYVPKKSLIEASQVGDVKTKPQLFKKLLREQGFDVDNPQAVSDVGATRNADDYVELLNTRYITKTVPVEKSKTDIVRPTPKGATNTAPVPEAEQVAIRDLAKRDQAALRPTRATGRIDSRDLKAEMEANINRYNEKIPDAEIVRIRKQNLLNPETIDEIILRKRGIITDAEAIERAKNIQGTLQDVIDLPKGTLATKEQYTAVEQIVANEREINKALQQAFDQGIKTGGVAERRLLEQAGPEFIGKSDDELLRLALQESTMKLKKAEIVLLGLRSEAGRSLQGMKQYVEGVDNRLRILFNNINRNKKLDEPAKEAMIEQITKLDVRNDKAFIKALDDILQPDMFDKFAEWSVAAKLWNPTTHIVNLGGNAIRQLLDLGIKTATNPMTARADWQGALHGLKIGLKNAAKVLTSDGYASQLSKYIEAGGNVPAIKGRLGSAVRTPFRMLSAGDEIFRNMAYQRKLHRDAYKIAKKEGLTGNQLHRRMEELLNTPTFKMMEDATNEAKHLTFQDELGAITSKINNLRDPAKYDSKGGKAFGVFARTFLPFLKTPTNLFKQSVDFSLFGLVKNWPELRKAAAAGDNEKVGTILGEAIVGTALVAYIVSEALDGNVTGGVPTEPDEKDRFYREKKLPYAIKMGDTWYQYQRLDPLALVVGMTADLANSKEPTLGALAATMSQNLQDKTYLSGVSDLMKLLTGEEWEREYVLKSALLGSAFPSFIGHTARSIDPTVRVTDTIGERLMSQTPGLSQELPARVNVLGYDVERANKGLNYFFNPIQTEEAGLDPVTQGLMEIDKSISIPNKKFQRDGVSYELTAEEYEDFARYTGVKIRSELEKLFEKPQYQRADIEKKYDMIDEIRTEAMNEWKDEYVASKEEKKQRVLNIIKKIQQQ